MITASGITKRFGDLEVLRGIDLEIPQGAVTCIVGPSGAGKTTLLQILGTLSRPDAGTLRYGNTEVSTLHDKALSRFRNANIGFVFQFHQLLPEFTVTENVALPAMIGGQSRAAAMEKARTLLRQLGLGTRLDHRPGQLSGGECQRAAVARALVNNPAVVLADEPTGSLDTHNRQQLQRLFFELRDSMGATFVIVTHDESLAADADYTIHMSDGQITSLTKRK